MASKQHATKKKGIVIASRFKQAAESYSSHSSKDSTLYSKLHSTTYSSKKCENDFSIHSSASDDVGCSGKNEISDKCSSSTPTSQGKCPLPPIEESVIGANLLQVPPRKEKIVKKRTLQRNRTANQTYCDLTLHIPVEGNSAQGSKEDEWELKLLHYEYLQAKLIQSYSMKACESRCQEPIEKIYRVWSYCQILIDESKSIQRELHTISFLNMIYDHLHKQEKMLLPVLELIPAVENHYESIAKSVHSAMYNLEANELILPDDDDHGKALITQLLHRMCDLIHNIFNNVQDFDKIIAVSKANHAFVNEGSLISDAFKLCSQILSRTNNLVLSDASLKLSSLNIE